MARARRVRLTVPARTEAGPRVPREVVRGIELQVTGRELAVRVGERIRWHRERADALIEQMKKLAEVERGASDELSNVFGRHDWPRVMLEKKLREHHERAAFLTFVRDHVDADATYRLDSTDLRMTEILPEKSW